MGWTSEKSWSDSQQGQVIYLFPTEPRPTLRPTSHPLDRYSGDKTVMVWSWPLNPHTTEANNDFRYTSLHSLPSGCGKDKGALIQVLRKKSLQQVMQCLTFKATGLHLNTYYPDARYKLPDTIRLKCFLFVLKALMHYCFCLQLIFISAGTLLFQILLMSRICLPIRLFLSTDITVNSWPVRALSALHVHRPLKSFHPFENFNLNHTHWPIVLDCHRVKRRVTLQILLLLPYTATSLVTSSRLTSCPQTQYI